MATRAAENFSLVSNSDLSAKTGYFGKEINGKADVQAALGAHADFIISGGQAAGLASDLVPYYGRIVEVTVGAVAVAQDAELTPDANGLAITATSVLPPPTMGATATATTGGTLTAATYGYRVTATNATGETLPGAEVQITTTGSTSTATINWTQVTGATGYKVYGRTAAGETLLATIASGSTLTYTDTGSGSPSGAMPTINSTANWVRCKALQAGNPGETIRALWVDVYVKP